MGVIPNTTTMKNPTTRKSYTTMDGPLLYLHDHKVIVCTTCCHCIKGDGVGLHLRRFHKEVPIDVRKECCSRVKERFDGGDLLAPEDLVSPARALGPVKELKIVDGFECLECGDVCGKLVTAQLHGRTHGWRIGKQETWKSQHVQVFINGVMLTCRHSLPATSQSIFQWTFRQPTKS
jgi:hypothetical protein